MAFYESPRFPERIAYGALGGPAFATAIASTVSGREARNAEWSYPLHQWDVSQGLRSAADYDVLRAFFMSVRGRLHGWRFKDWSDYQATVSQGFVTGITGTTFQLIKRYTSGAQTLDRVITKPVATTVQAYISGTPTASTLDTATGVLTIGSAPDPATVTWAGEFDVPMRFDTDALSARLVARNAQGLLHEWSSIPIRETRDIA